MKRLTNILSLFIITILISNCTDDGVLSIIPDPTENYKGKIKSYSTYKKSSSGLMDSLIDITYFQYKALDGKLLFIHTIDSNFTLAVDYTNDSTINYEWMNIEPSRSGRIEVIFNGFYLNNYAKVWSGSNFEGYYYASYSDSAIIDTLHEPNVLSSHVNVFNSQYEYNSDNCTKHQVEYQGTFGGAVMYDAEYTYTDYTNSKYIPWQQNYSLITSIYSPISVLYLFAQSDIYAMKPNKNLIATSNDHSFTYGLDGMNRVNEMLREDIRYSQNTILYKIEYY